MRLSRIFLLAALLPVVAAAQIPAGYPADYAKTIAAAKAEGKVVIYSALDTKAAQPLIKDFNAVYPDIKVEYNDMNSTELYNRFIAEVAAGQGGADVMWSSAMDLQVKLVDDGKAMAYKSPESAEAACVVGVQERGLRDDIRAGGLHLQQAPGDGRRDPDGPRVVREDHQRATPTSSRARSPRTTSRRAAWASCSWCRTRSTSRA